MESIEQMINRLCPKGVEWKKINEIGTIYRGVAFSKKDFTEKGTPCIHYGQIYTKFGNSAYKTYTHVSEQLSKGKKLAQKGDLVMAVTSENMEDVGKCLAWLGEEDILISNHACYIRHSLNPMYLAYYLQSSHFFNYKKKISKGVKVIDLDLNMFGDMLIPVPPMEVQNRIVDILDKMTFLTAKLEAELKAELDARKQQYEYYRNKLLTFNEIGGGIERVIWKKISEIAQFPKARIKSEMLTVDTYVGVESLIKNRGGKTSSSSVPEGAAIEFLPHDILIGNIRPYLKKIWLSDCQGGTNGDVVTIRVIDSNEIMPKFLYYILASDSFFDYDNSHAKGGKMPRGDKNAILAYNVPVPSMEEQERIVSILDRFEALTTDLQIGLPAEIEARRQQYEYYRNKLLTFDKAA